MQQRTFVIFSMFFTDLRRNSISRRVAMLRAWEGAAPSAGGWDAIRPSVRRASISRRKGEGVVDVVVRAVDVDFGKWRVPRSGGVSTGGAFPAGRPDTRYSRRVNSNLHTVIAGSSGLKIHELAVCYTSCTLELQLALHTRCLKSLCLTPRSRSARRRPTTYVFPRN